jgi:hypothetical protein
MAEGRSFETFAATCNIGRRTLYKWAEDHEEFRHAKELGDEKALKWFENISRTAMTTGMIIGPDGKLMPQAMNSTVYRMTAFNRFGWRDKIDHTHTGKDGGPIRLQSMSPKELADESEKITKEITADLNDEDDPCS